MHLTYFLFICALFSNFLANDAKPAQLAPIKSDDIHQLQQAIKDLTDKFDHLDPVVQRIIKGSKTGDCNAHINGSGPVQPIGDNEDIEQLRKDVAALANRYNQYILWTRRGFKQLGWVCGDHFEDPGLIEPPKSPQSIEQLTHEVKDIVARLEPLKPIIQCAEQVICPGPLTTTTK